MAMLNGAGSSGEGVLQPLMFDLDIEDKMSAVCGAGEATCTTESDSMVSTENVVVCMLCDDKFEDSKSFCQHMVLEHKIVISDSKLIAHLKSYAEYWKNRFKECPYETICTKIVIGNEQKNEGGDFCVDFVYLLGSDIEEDKLLREKLRRARLEVVLQQSAKERNDNNFSRACVFCKKLFVGNRTILFKHMAADHNFSVGRPDNLVFVNEFLDLLEEKVDKNIECLYCERKFKDKTTLKEHMRKKVHKKINPKNKDFDKFYSINYLEVGKTWEDVNAEDDSEIQEVEEDTEEQWGGWRDKSMDSVCLFCDLHFPNFDAITKHMREAHKFNLIAIRKAHKMNYYRQVKFVNFIRRQMLQLNCFSCLRRFTSRDILLDHLVSEKHINFIPDQSMWDQPQYYFPTYENDNLLCNLECDGLDTFESLAGQGPPTPSGDASRNSSIVSEDLVNIPTDSILWSEELRNQLR